MRVVLSAPAKYHIFNLGRELANRGLLTALITGYPKFKLREETEVAPYIRSFPLVHVLYLGVLAGLGLDFEYWDKWAFDRSAKRNLPDCDVFMGIAASCIETATLVRSRGGAVIIDRPCSHIEVQDRLLQEEAKNENLELKPIDPRVIKLELEEYDFADLITVPSEFAARSFYEKGFSTDKIRVIPYGIDQSVFHPVGEPDPEAFNVLFVGTLSIRKGIVHLLRAFEKLEHKNKSLTLIGTLMPEIKNVVHEFAKRLPVKVLGHLPQEELKVHMSRCHVFVLPSIEDGYGLVMSQAMACGAPVVASANTGAEMLITEGVEGFIVPAADDDVITDRLQKLADDRESRAKMSQAARQRIAKLNGWSTYAQGIVDMFESLRS